MAAKYAVHIGDELAGKPLDRALLNAFAELVAGAGAGPVLDVGSGPGHVAAYLAQRGVAVVSTDLSPQMCSLAAMAGLPSFAADMTALPVASGMVGGIVCLYAVIHLDSEGRAAAYAAFQRVLRPGGVALIAFHTRDVDHAPDDAAMVTEWWDEPVSLTFRFLDPAAECEALLAVGFELVARLDRKPGPGEHASERSYLLVQQRV